MVGFIRSLFGSSDSNVYFKPKERLIYKYWDGKKDVLADPMVLFRKLLDVLPEMDANRKLASSEHSQSRKGHNEMIRQMRGIFSVQSYEEGGLTESETMDLLDHFVDYCNNVKKNSRTSMMSSKTLEDSTNSLVEESPIASSLGSGLTEEKASIEDRQPCPLV